MTPASKVLLKTIPLPANDTISLIEPSAFVITLVILTPETVLADGECSTALDPAECVEVGGSPAVAGLAACGGRPMSTPGGGCPTSELGRAVGVPIQSPLGVTGNLWQPPEHRLMLHNPSARLQSFWSCRRSG